MITAVPYSEWAVTAETLHMILQMMGKVKLRRMDAQPEWNHALLYVTPGGFTTGLIPHGQSSFAVEIDLAASTVTARCTSGMTAGFTIGGVRSVASYYAEFNAMLAHIGHDTPINAIPQEMANTTPFDQQTTPYLWDAAAAHDYFDTCVFSRNALLTFASPFRNKKILPVLFWGTFDMTTVLFSGVERPFPGKGLIEQVAFDEQFIEFGFWPGDPATDEPSFFVLPYPFLEKDLSGSKVRPDGAFYSMAKKEYFLPLRVALAQPDPQQAVIDFCRDTFDVLSREEKWPDVQWFTKPLLC